MKLKNSAGNHAIFGVIKPLEEIFMKKKVINSIAGVLTLAMIVVGFVFMLQFSESNRVLFFVFLTMHVLGWIMISVTAALFLFIKKTQTPKKEEK